jgi:4-hydroxy-2-oxoheptanedioate aldolase
MRENRLRTLWAAGQTAINGWLAVPSSLSAEVVARQGWDSITVDLQHGGVDEGHALTMLQAISLGNAAPLVRAPWNEPGVIMRLLDAGAYGVICPMISNREEAERFVGACRYPPDGYRSNGAYRGLMYGGGDYIERANETIVTLAMIETREGMANLDEIAATPGLDGLYIGPSDLALAHDQPARQDNFDGPVADLIARIREAAHRAGKVAGVHATRTDYAARMRDDGFDIVTPTSDLRLLAAAGAAVLKELGKA